MCICTYSLDVFAILYVQRIETCCIIALYKWINYYYYYTFDLQHVKVMLESFAALFSLSSFSKHITPKQLTIEWILMNNWALEVYVICSWIPLALNIDVGHFVSFSALFSSWGVTHKCFIIQQKDDILAMSWCTCLKIIPILHLVEPTSASSDFILLFYIYLLLDLNVSVEVFFWTKTYVGNTSFASRVHKAPGPLIYYWGIPSSDGIPYGLAEFFFFFFFTIFSPSAAEYSIPGGQTQWRTLCIDLVF